MRARIVATILTVLTLGVFWSVSTYAYNIVKLVDEENPPINAETVGGSIVGFDYGPYRDGQKPYGPCPSDSQIQEDLLIMKKTPYVSNVVRTYTVGDGSCNLSKIVDIAQSVGNNIVIGAWISGDPEHDDQEINTVINVANSHSFVRAVIVGSETLRFGRLLKEDLIQYIDQVRANVSVPVSTAEPDGEWLNNQDLADHVDFIFVNIHPYWAGISIDYAVDWTVNTFYTIKNTFSDKLVVISETGWPTEGETNGEAVPTLANQRTFLKQLYKRSRREELPFFIFEAFDETWKVGWEVEKHWGVYNSDRTPKN